VLPDLNLSGIISCIAVNPLLKNMYALGSFRNKIGLYLDDGTVISVLEGHLGGLTHLKFSHDGNKLFSGGRKVCYF
jgi:WD40 repeat protein